MKRLILAALGVGMLVGFGFYMAQPGIQPVSPAEPEPTAIPVEGPQTLEPVAAPMEARAHPVETETIAKSTPRPAATPASPGVDATFLSRAVDLVVSTQVGYRQKREVWKQLREAGQLDQAISELERLVATEPRTAEYQVALGRAYLQKCAALQDVRDMGILAMQADKAFDTALSLDPSNWEARFTKAVAMSYWPATLNKGDEVIQHFETLIQQQETQASQPEFADTYAWLGDQYQKAGRSNDARAIWQRGAALFPADEGLRTKLALTQ